MQAFKLLRFFGWGRRLGCLGTVCGESCAAAGINASCLGLWMGAEFRACMWHGHEACSCGLLCIWGSFWRLLKKWCLCSASASPFSFGCLILLSACYAYCANLSKVNWRCFSSYIHVSSWKNRKVSDYHSGSFSPLMYRACEFVHQHIKAVF